MHLQPQHELRETFCSGAEASHWYDNATDEEILDMAGGLDVAETDVTVLRDLIGSMIVDEWPDQAE